MKILVFDNYDSFTYNLVHLVEKILHEKVDVYRNDKIPLERVKEYDRIILSPGPGIPEEAGLLLPLIKEYACSKPILGVCLGHQAIGQAFGGKLVNLSNVYHGVATRIVTGHWSLVNGETAIVNGDGDKSAAQSSAHGAQLTIDDSRFNLFAGLPREITVGRYHSWVISEEDFPEELDITARDENGMIMALQHKTYNVQGVQFHPESVLTPDGDRIMRNWLGR